MVGQPLSPSNHEKEMARLQRASTSYLFKLYLFSFSETSRNLETQKPGVNKPGPGPA